MVIIRRESLKDFNPEGIWRVARLIRHDDGSRGRFQGRAEFTPDGLATRWRYAETGALILKTGRFEASQRYIWQRQDTDFTIYFPDGRFFHAFSDIMPEAQHLCVNDLYRTRYAFESRDCFTQYWRVDGPNKAYTLCSRYRRQPG